MTDNNDAQSYEDMLQEDISGFYASPLRFVLYAFEWDKPPLVNFGGPDQWQIDIMRSIERQVLENKFDGSNPVPAVREAVASGHGIGKSALTAWLILWLMSTRPHAKGVVTANTSDQLKTKTWAELGKWRKRCITGHWFEYNNTKGNMNLYHKAYQESWRCDAQTCREENSEAFAGNHAADSSSFYIFDEASAIPDKIWEVAQGGMTDGEPFWFAFGNPTRNYGAFRECFRKFRKRWRCRKIDSRDVRITNKQFLNELVEDNGEESDVVKVRVRGEFPAQSDEQYVSEAVVLAAMNREPPDERNSPLIGGIDFGRGSDPTVIRWRRGRDAVTVPPAYFSERDSMKLAAKISAYLDGMYANPLTIPDKIFGDGGGLGGPIIDRLNQLGYEVMEVNSAWGADNERHYANKRAEMAARSKDWLSIGSLSDNEVLKEDLCADQVVEHTKDLLLMMSKKELIRILGRSPDDGDAHKLTFAYYVAPKSALDELMNNKRGQVRTNDNQHETGLGFRPSGEANKVRVS